MRELLVVGGEGNMSGMCADRIPDDMKGLLSGLNNTSQYQKIIFVFSHNFLQPSKNPEELLPYMASKDNMAQNSIILEKATRMAVTLFYETLLSFAGEKQIITIFGAENELCPTLLPFYYTARSEGLQHLHVRRHNCPLTEGIKNWPFVFERFRSTIFPDELLPDRDTCLSLPWGAKTRSPSVLGKLRHILDTKCAVRYPAEDSLKNPRALLVKAKNGGNGFLLSIPRPANMKNFSISLRAGRFDQKKSKAVVGNAPSITRTWMTREETAVAIGKSKDTVDNLREKGVLDSSTIGRTVRISQNSIQTYLDAKGKTAGHTK